MAPNSGTLEKERRSSGEETKQLVVSGGVKVSKPVPELFTAIREKTKEAVKEFQSTGGTANHNHHGDNTMPIHAFHMQLFEVLYVGKVLVSSKKTPPTFIDEAVDRFHEYEEKRRADAEQEKERRRHASGASVRSLPSDLQTAVSIKENELAEQLVDTPGGSTDYNSNEAINGDDVPLGGSSSSMALQNALAAARSQAQNQTHGSRKLSTSDEGLQDSTTVRNNNAGTTNNPPPFLRHLQKDNENLQRSTTEGQSQTNSGFVQKNRTMLIQVGPSDLSLISPDRKSVIFERSFKDISFCSQGIRYPEHFGFISRDSSSNNFMCYVFCCTTESVVEEVMQTLKQAFQNAFQQNAKNYIVCEQCPMHQLHKLCLELDKMPPEKVHETLFRRIDQLADKDRNMIFDKLKLECPQSIQETNEVMMMILRYMCELKQKEHVHISDSNRSMTSKPEFTLAEPKSIGSKFDHLKSRAKKSLANSFENLIKGKTRKDEAREAFRERSHSTADSDCSVTTRSFESSVDYTPDSTPCTSPMSKDFRTQFPTPPRPEGRFGRPRSATVGDVPISEIEELCSPMSDKSSKSTASREAAKATDSAIVNMFMKVGQTNREQLGRESSLSPTLPGHRPTPGKTPVRSRKTSWRMDILNRVVTPAKIPPPARSISHSGEYHPTTVDEVDAVVAKPKRILSTQRIRQLWKKAILETLLEIRTKKAKISLPARQDDEELRPLKLDYEEITPCLKEVTKVWQGILRRPDRTLHKIERHTLIQALKDGVPRHLRGEIWRLLVEQHCLNNPGLQHQWSGPELEDQCYNDLLKQLTAHQHAILIDLGRTFPAHPYFTTQLGPGQLSLFNLLKAYSLLDKEVGYCQGLSFVAGVLLMHMGEEKAFGTMRYMMFNLGFRRQYKPDMVPLQIQLYQLSRLLHDNHRDLYEHLENHDIAPTLYAAPWFLTLFASQFPLGFVARVFDLIFLQGMEAVFKVALVLLGNHKELIKQCDSFEEVVEFLKTTLPGMGIIQMERIINQVFAMDISKQLHAYEVEYHVLQEEMVTTPQRSDSDVLCKLESANSSLKRQNLELLEQLQTAHSNIHSMEVQLHNVHTSQTKLKSHICTLELERAALLNTVTRLRQLIPEDALTEANINIPPFAPDVTLTNSQIHNPAVRRFVEEGTEKLTGSALSELDKEVASLMVQAKTQGLKAKSQVGNLKLEVSQQQNQRPSSSNY